METILGCRLETPGFRRLQPRVLGVVRGNVIRGDLPVRLLFESLLTSHRAEVVRLASMLAFRRGRLRVDFHSASPPFFGGLHKGLGRSPPSRGTHLSEPAGAWSPTA